MGIEATPKSSREPGLAALLLSRRGRLETLYVPALAGAAFALAAPPTNLYVMLWLGMAALAFELARGTAHPNALLEDDVDEGSRARRAFAGGARGLAFGFGANVVALRFVPDVIARFTPLPWVVGVVALALLALFEGLRWWVAAMLARGAIRLALPAWLAFAIGVYGGTFVPTIFPWSAAGGVTPWPAMVQLAEIVGERGVTFVMALAAGLFASGARALLRGEAIARASAPVAVAIAIPLATLAYGARRMAEVDAMRSRATTAKVVLVQPSIGASERWDEARAGAILSKLTDLTKSAERKGAELTVWPEAAYPYPLHHSSRVAPIGELAILPFGVRGPVLTGVVLSERRGESYNSAFVATADGKLSEPQDKQHLVWFGETVPFADRSAWFRRMFARGLGLVPGSKSTLQQVGALRMGVLNCFEDTLPDAGREIMATRPNLLVNVTNDAWFAGSAESELHLRLAVLRSVEHRRDLVRAVNFGPTSWVDAAGRVRARYASDIAGTLLTEPALIESAPTFYARFGDLPLAAFLFTMCAASAVERWRTKEKGHRAEAPCPPFLPRRDRRRAFGRGGGRQGPLLTE